MLNAVGLSGLGLMTLLTDGRWQERDKPFFISIAAVGKTRGERLGEISAMIRMLVMFKTSFNTPFGLQINFSCPNAGHKLNGADNELVSEVAEVLDIALELGVPLVPKFAVTLSLNAMQNVARLRACDALHFSNTIPFGQLPERINWKGIFGSEQSPLTKYGGGGLSGPKLFPLVLERVKELREAGIEKPILAGGGITRQQDVYQLFQAGNKQVGDFAIALGAVVPFRPWRVAGIIRRAHELCKR